MYQRLHQGPFPCRGDQIQAGGGSGREPRRPTAWTATDTSGARVPLLAPAEARTRRWPGHLPHALNQWGRIARRISLRGGGLFARRELLIPCVPPPPPPWTRQHRVGGGLFADRHHSLFCRFFLSAWNQVLWGDRDGGERSPPTPTTRSEQGMRHTGFLWVVPGVVPGAVPWSQQPGPGGLRKRTKAPLQSTPEFGSPEQKSFHGVGDSARKPTCSGQGMRRTGFLWVVPQVTPGAVPLSRRPDPGGRWEWKRTPQTHGRDCDGHLPG